MRDARARELFLAESLVQAAPDRHQVCVVSHWGFILQLTGHSAVNAELVPFDPTRERQARVRA